MRPYMFEINAQDRVINPPDPNPKNLISFKQARMYKDAKKFHFFRAE
jgi:hypothetical protein